MVKINRHYLKEDEPDFSYKNRVANEWMRIRDNEKVRQLVRKPLYNQVFIRNSDGTRKISELIHVFMI